MFLTVINNTISLHDGTNYFTTSLENFLSLEEDSTFSSSSRLAYFPNLMHHETTDGVTVALALEKSEYDSYIVRTPTYLVATTPTPPVAVPTIDEAKDELLLLLARHASGLLDNLTEKYHPAEQQMWKTLVAEAEDYINDPLKDNAVSYNIYLQVQARLAHSNLTPAELRNYTLDYAISIVDKARITNAAINAIVGTRGRLSDFIETLKPQLTETDEQFVLRLSSINVVELFKVP